MHTDHHSPIRRIIDKSLAGEATPQEEQSLRAHLQLCAGCQQYLDTNTRAIASLDGFSFEVNPQLQTKVLAALTLRAQELDHKQPTRMHWLWSCVIALALTAVGSLIVLQFENLLAEFLRLQRAQIQLGVLAFWAVPSLCLSLLLPIVMMSMKGTSRKGRIL